MAARYGDFAAARFRPGQQQVGDVDASDQQNERNRAQQNQHCRAHASDDPPSWKSAITIGCRLGSKGWLPGDLLSLDCCA